MAAEWYFATQKMALKCPNLIETVGRSPLLVGTQVRPVAHSAFCTVRLRSIADSRDARHDP